MAVVLVLVFVLKDTSDVLVHVLHSQVLALLLATQVLVLNVLVPELKPLTMSLHLLFTARCRIAIGSFHLKWAKRPELFRMTIFKLHANLTDCALTCLKTLYKILLQYSKYCLSYGCLNKATVVVFELRNSRFLTFLKF